MNIFLLSIYLLKNSTKLYFDKSSYTSLSKSSLKNKRCSILFSLNYLQKSYASWWLICLYILMFKLLYAFLHINYINYFFLMFQIWSKKAFPHLSCMLHGGNYCTFNNFKYICLPWYEIFTRSLWDWCVYGFFCLW